MIASGNQLNVLDIGISFIRLNETLWGFCITTENLMGFPLSIPSCIVEQKGYLFFVYNCVYSSFISTDGLIRATFRHYKLGLSPGPQVGYHIS
jgi:hypothetical protein